MAGGGPLVVAAPIAASAELFFSEGLKTLLTEFYGKTVCSPCGTQSYCTVDVDEVLAVVHQQFPNITTPEALADALRVALNGGTGETDRDTFWVPSNNASGTTTFTENDENGPTGRTITTPALAVTSVNYGTAEDGGDEFINEAGTAYRINPRVDLTIIELPNFSEDGTDPVAQVGTNPYEWINIQHPRKFARSKLEVTIHVQGDVRARNTQVGDGVFWSYGVEGEVSGALGPDIQRIANNKYNNSESGDFDPINGDGNATSHAGSRSYIVPETANTSDNLTDIIVRAGFNGGVVPTYSELGTPIPAAQVRHRGLSDSHIVIREFEVLP